MASRDEIGVLTDTFNDLRSSLEQISSFEHHPDRDAPRKIIVSNTKWHDSFNDSKTKAIFDARIDGENDHMVYIDKDNKLYYSHSFYDKESGGTVLERLPIPKETEVVLSETAKKLLKPAKNKEAAFVH